MISITLSLMRGLIAIPIKIPTSCPEETEDDSKLMWKFKGSRIGKTTFKRENRIGGLARLAFKTHDEAVWAWAEAMPWKGEAGAGLQGRSRAKGPRLAGGLREVCLANVARTLGCQCG